MTKTNDVLEHDYNYLYRNYEINNKDVWLDGLSLQSFKIEARYERAMIYEVKVLSMEANCIC